MTKAHRSLQQSESYILTAGLVTHSCAEAEVSGAVVSLTETCNCTALVSERRAERGSVSFIFIATVLWLVSF